MSIASLGAAIRASIRAKPLRMQNAFQRRLAGVLIRGQARETVTRFALAARYAERFDTNKNRFPDRFALYDFVSREFIGGSAFDYLEFGVFRGDSIRYIAGHNPNPAARFWGFDSFEGLPSDWNERNPQGAFGVGGRIPDIADQRVRFIKGWFEDTLPRFLRDYEPQAKLWLHIDADLYSSAIEVLVLLKRYIRRDTVIVFDEIEDLMNEFKALCDFEVGLGRPMRLVGATEEGRQAAFLSA